MSEEEQKADGASIDIDVTVNLNIKGKSVSLTLAELKDLQDKTREILNYVKETQFVPTYPVYREPFDPIPDPLKDPYPDRGPWVKPKDSGTGRGPYPYEITWSIGSRTKNEL